MRVPKRYCILWNKFVDTILDKRKSAVHILKQAWPLVYMFRCEGSLGVWYNCTYKSCRVGKSCAKLINELAAWEYVDWVEIDSKKYNNECELVRLFIEYKTDAERDKFVSQVRNYGENLKYPLED